MTLDHLLCWQASASTSDRRKLPALPGARLPSQITSPSPARDRAPGVGTQDQMPILPPSGSSLIYYCRASPLALDIWVCLAK